MNGVYPASHLLAAGTDWWRLVALTLTLIVGYHNQKGQQQSETMLELTTTSKRPCDATHKTEVQAFLKAYRINQIQCL